MYVYSGESEVYKLKQKIKKTGVLSKEQERKGTKAFTNTPVTSLLSLAFLKIQVTARFIYKAASYKAWQISERHQSNSNF